MKPDDELFFAVNDPARVCPVFSGPARLRGRRLTVRLADREVVIDAPMPLLSLVFDHCDGHHSRQEIVTASGHRALADAFIDDLTDQGVLVDAANWVAHAARAAGQPRGWGRTAMPSAWKVAKQATTSASSDLALSPRPSPLSKYLGQRRSARTFSGDSISSAALTSLLWAMYGSTKRRGEAGGRTVASAGGFYCLQFRLILRRVTGSLAPGIYELSFPTNGDVGFTRVEADVARLGRALVQPDLVEHAIGIVVIAADVTLPSLKYRNRAWQYQLIEAGQALQNAALMAAELGLGLTDLGGYDDSRLADLCGFGDTPVLAAAVFGAGADETQTRQARRCLPVEFRWIDAPAGLEAYVGRARVELAADEDWSWGRAGEPEVAHAKAVGEAIERYAWRNANGLIQAAFAKISAIDPTRLISYSAAQYRRKGFPFCRFDPNRVSLWKRATSWPGGAEAFVLAECVHAAAAFDVKYRESLYTSSTTSGCAAATSFDEAILHGVLELVERDALMRTWAAQSGGRAIAMASLPGRLVVRLQRLKDEGCEVTVQSLASSLTFVCLIGIHNTRLGFVCFGSAASLVVEEAIDSALGEAEIAAWARLGGYVGKKISPKRVAAPVDHSDLYAQRQYVNRADALWKPRREVALSAVAANAAKSVPILQSRMKASNLQVFAVDLSLPNAGLGQGRRPLYVARAFVPGLIPITFGAGCMPLGMLPHRTQGVEFPHPFS